MTVTHSSLHMSNRETKPNSSVTDSHATAAEAFIDRVRSRLSDEVSKVYVFGSTIRGDTRGLASDVDVLIILEDNATHATVSEELHDLAYDVMLEFGPVVELHVLSETEFRTFVNEGNPFIQNVLHEGRSYAC